MSYEVNLYDKDNDTYQRICTTDDLKQATDFCLVIAQLIKGEMVVNWLMDKSLNKFVAEPFDYVEVYDNKNKKVLMINEEMQK